MLFPDVPHQQMYSRVAPQPQPVSSASPIPSLVQLHPQLVDLPQQAFQQSAPHTAPHTGSRPQPSNEQQPPIQAATNNQWQQQQQSYAQQQQLHQQLQQQHQQQEHIAMVQHKEQRPQQQPQSSSYFTASSFQQVEPRAPADDAIFKVPQPPTSKRQQVRDDTSVLATIMLKSIRRLDY